MATNVRSVAQQGYDGIIIDVECDLSNGLPSINIVGLGDKAVAEAKERVRSAISNSKLQMPTKRLTLNLAPADVPKQGSYLDLALAAAILVASKQIPSEVAENCLIAGELSLDGSLRPIKGIINLAQTARQNKIKRIIIPYANAEQASLVDNLEIIPVNSLSDFYKYANNQLPIKPYRTRRSITANKKLIVDISEIKGQAMGKRAIEIAVAGGHNVLLTGPPGTGKSMLAKAMTGIMPPLTNQEKLEVTKLHSLAGININSVVQQRPFRGPHHTSSNISIIGGGANPKPGEVSLAHNGVLFLDEIPEYSRSTLETLRQPLEDKQVTIARVNDNVTYPANFILVATKNPCHCGYYGDSKHNCSCTPQQIKAYSDKLSGPLLDRIDIVTQVDRIDNSRLLHSESSSLENSATIKERIAKARRRQAKRFKSENQTNSHLTSKQITQFGELETSAKDLLDSASSKLSLSSRGYIRCLRVARTIADLENSDSIKPEHISEALSYRIRKENI